MKDNEIISLFELRDEHAIEALSDKYHPYCYKIAWNLLTNKEDSEECLNADASTLNEEYGFAAA